MTTTILPAVIFREEGHDLPEMAERAYAELVKYCGEDYTEITPFEYFAGSSYGSQYRSYGTAADGSRYAAVVTLVH